MKACSIVKMAFVAALLAAACATVGSAQSLNRDLIRNGNADQGTSYWRTDTGYLATLTRNAVGKVGRYMFWSSRSAYAAAYQDIVVSNTAITGGGDRVNFFLSAQVGGGSSQNDRASVSLDFLTSSKSKIETAATLGPVTVAERGYSSKLLYKSEQGCTIPATTQYLRVWMRFYRVAGSNNDGFVDDLKLYLYETRPAFALATNLLGSPGAESGGYVCAWSGSPERTSSSATGKAGSWMYYGGTDAHSSMYQDVDIAPDAGPIDRGERALWASAMIGASASDDDTARVVMYFYTSSRGFLGQQELPNVTRADRGSASKLLLRTATACKLPQYTRIVRLHVTFSRRSGSTNNAWVDQLDLQLLAVTSPSFAWDRDLIAAGQADSLAYACAWATPSGAVGMHTSDAYVAGRSGTEYYVGPATGESTADQWIDISSAQASVDAGNTILQYEGLLGGKASAVAEAWVMMSAAKSDAAPLQDRRVAVVTKADRADANRLQTVRAFECSVPSGTRWMRLRLVLKSGGGGAAMADAQTVQLIKTTTPAFGLHRNLVNQPDPEPYYTCAWSKDANVTRWRPPGASTFRFAATEGPGVLRQTINVTAEASWIDQRLRTVDLSGDLGGYTTIASSAAVTFAFLREDGTAHRNVTLGPIDESDRKSRTAVLPRAANPLVVPRHTCAIEISLVFTGTYGMAGALSVVMRENTLTPTISIVPRLSKTSSHSVSPSAKPTRSSTPTLSTTLSGRTLSSSPLPTATGTLALSLTLTPSVSAPMPSMTVTSPVSATPEVTPTGRATPTAIPTVSTPKTITPALATPAPTAAPTPAPSPAPTPAPHAGSSSSSAMTSNSAASSSVGSSSSAPSATPAPRSSGASASAPSMPSLLPSRPPAVSSSSATSAASSSSAAAGTPQPTPALIPRTPTATPTLEPPVPPTPVPPSIVPSGLSGAAAATSGLAGTVGVVAASPAAAAQVGRVVAVLFAAEYCGRGSLSMTTELPFLVSPTGVGFGPEKGKYYRGAVAGNVALMAGVCLVITVVVGVVQAFHSGTLVEAAALLLFPSCLLLVVGVLLTGTTLAGVAAALSGGSPGLDWAMLAVALLIGSAAVAYTVYFSFQSPALRAVEFVPSVVDPASRRKRNVCSRFGAALWADSGAWLPRPQQLDRLDVPRLRMHALLYDKFRGKQHQRWVLVDLVATILVGAAAGLAPTSCTVAVSAVAAVLVVVAVGAWVARPFTFTLMNVLFGCLCTLAAVAALLVAASVHLDDGSLTDSLLEASAYAAVACMFLIAVSVVVAAVKALTLCCRADDPKRLNEQFADELETELRAHGDLLGVRDEVEIDLMELTNNTVGSASALPSNNESVRSVHPDIVLPLSHPKKPAHLSPPPKKVSATETFGLAAPVAAPPTKALPPHRASMPSDDGSEPSAVPPGLPLLHQPAAPSVLASVLTRKGTPTPPSSSSGDDDFFGTKSPLIVSEDDDL